MPDVNDMNQGELVMNMVASLENIFNVLSAKENNPIEFAASPFVIKPKELINMNSKAGYAHFTIGSKKLMDEMFDGKPDKVLPFLEKLQKRAVDFVWDDGDQGIVDFIIAIGEVVNVLKDYGRISLDEIREQMLDCIGTGTHSQSRKAQNNKMMGDAIQASLSPSLDAKLKIFRAQYMVEDTNHHGEKETYTLAHCMLKKILEIVNHDCKASEMRIRQDLDHLPQCLASCKGNIPIFNSYFDDKIKQLLARGIDYDGAIMRLLAAYKKCPDSEFRRYITKKYEDYMDGSSGSSEWTTEYIMSL